MEELRKENFKKKQQKKDVIKEELEDKVEVARKLNAMLKTPGWKILENYLDDKLDTAINALTKSNNERDIYYNQAVMAVIKEMLERVGISKKLGKDAQEILNKY